MFSLQFFYLTVLHNRLFQYLIINFPVYLRINICLTANIHKSIIFMFKMDNSLAIIEKNVIDILNVCILIITTKKILFSLIY